MVRHDNRSAAAITLVCLLSVSCRMTRHFTISNIVHLYQVHYHYQPFHWDRQDYHWSLVLKLLRSFVVIDSNCKIDFKPANLKSFSRD